MTDLPNPNTLFGVSRGLEASEVASLTRYLKAAWTAQYGRDPSTLAVDLDTLADLFKSHAQGKRVRAVVDQLRPIKLQRPLLTDAIFIEVDDDRGIVTPEGRVLLEHLLAADGDELVLGRDALLNAALTIAEFYAAPQRQWMRKEITGGTAHPATIGFAIFLLLNGSIGEDNAFLLPASSDDEAALAATVTPIINTFATGIGGNPLKERERLRSNWVITEARRQLGRFILRAEREGSAYFWVPSETTASLVDDIGARLAARRGVDASDAHQALQRTAEAYDAARPVLTSWGLAHSRRGASSDLLASIESAYHRAKVS